jgi:TPR repeat protein
VDTNKFCGECGQLLNDPHAVGRFSVMQARANDAEALSASRAGVDNERAPFPHNESVPREYFDQWRPIEPDPPEMPRITPVTQVPEPQPVGTERGYTARSHDSVLGLSEPERTYSNTYVAMEPERREEAPLHGPSFLGLGDTPAGYTYTYEDPKPPRTRMWLALGVLVILVVLGALQWRAIGNGLRYSKEGILRITLPLRNRQANQSATNQQQADQTAANGSSEPQMVVEEPKPPANQGQDENPPAAAESSTPSETSKAEAAKPDSETDSGGTASAADSETSTAKSDSTAAAESTRAEATKDTTEADKPVETASAKPPRPAAKREPEPAAEEPPRIGGGEAELKSALAAKEPAVQAALLWKAVGKGNVDAQVRLADMYAYGVGVPQNCEQAMVLMRSASGKPSVRARVKMGAMYSAGKCVPQDRVMAYRWMGRALELDPGSDWVRQNRESLWSQMSPDERVRAGRR